MAAAAAIRHIPKAIAQMRMHISKNNRSGHIRIILLTAGSNVEPSMPRNTSCNAYHNDRKSTSAHAAIRTKKPVTAAKQMRYVLDRCLKRSCFSTIMNTAMPIMATLMQQALAHITPV